MQQTGNRTHGAIRVLAVAALALASSPVLADGVSSPGEWVRIRTPQGCVVHWAYYHPGKQTLQQYYDRLKVEYRGSGCAPGEPANGEGEVFVYWDGRLDLRMRGRVTDGVIDGSGSMAYTDDPYWPQDFVRGCPASWVSEGMCIPFAGRAHGAVEAKAPGPALEAAPSASEPGPLGLRDMPDEALAKMAGRDEAESGEPVLKLHYLGLDCLRIEQSPWELNSDKAWHAEFNSHNECGYEILVRLDTAERNEDESSPHGYTVNGGLVSLGILNGDWPRDVPFPMAWNPDGMNGVIWRGSLRPNLYLASSRGPRRYIDVYIYACPLYQEGTGRPQIMFIENSRLIEGGQKGCFPFPEDGGG